jgi:hypothetical protein
LVSSCAVRFSFAAPHRARSQLTAAAAAQVASLRRVCIERGSTRTWTRSLSSRFCDLVCRDAPPVARNKRVEHHSSGRSLSSHISRCCLHLDSGLGQRLAGSACRRRAQCKSLQCPEHPSFTLHATLLLAAPAAAVRSAQVWIATPYRLDAAANTLAHTPLPRGTAYVLMSGISLALLALR